VIVRYMQDVLFERQTPADAAKGFIADITQSIASAG